METRLDKTNGKWSALIRNLLLMKMSIKHQIWGVGKVQKVRSNLIMGDEELDLLFPHHQLRIVLDRPWLHRLYYAIYAKQAPLAAHSLESIVDKAVSRFQ